MSDRDTKPGNIDHLLGFRALERDARSPGTGYAPDPLAAQLTRAGISVPGVEVIEHVRVPAGGPRVRLGPFTIEACDGTSICGGRGYVDDEHEPRERYCDCPSGARLRISDGAPTED
jgi:hypothetical protein